MGVPEGDVIVVSPPRKRWESSDNDGAPQGRHALNRMIGHINIVAIALEIWCMCCWVFVNLRMRRQVLERDSTFGDWDYDNRKTALLQYWDLLKAHGEYFPSSSLRLSSGLFIVAMLAVVVFLRPPWW